MIYGKIIIGALATAFSISVLTLMISAYNSALFDVSLATNSEYHLKKRSPLTFELIYARPSFTHVFIFGFDVVDKAGINTGYRIYWRLLPWGQTAMSVS